MSKWKIILFTTITLLIGLRSNGQTFHKYSQDTIVFQKKKNKNKQFKLPLNDYSVFIKQKNEKKKEVIITGYTDTTFIVKIYSFEKSEQKTKNEALAKIYLDTSLTDTRIDSLTKLLMYSIQDTISISKIEKLIIPNRKRVEMKRIFNIMEWSAVTWLLVGIPAIAVFKSTPYIISLCVGGIVIVTVSLITENKVIKFDKWEVLH
jgi:hypothetical protein